MLGEDGAAVVTGVSGAGIVADSSRGSHFHPDARLNRHRFKCATTGGRVQRRAGRVPCWNGKRTGPAPGWLAPPGVRGWLDCPGQAQWRCTWGDPPLLAATGSRQPREPPGWAKPWTQTGSIIRWSTAQLRLVREKRTAARISPKPSLPAPDASPDAGAPVPLPACTGWHRPDGGSGSELWPVPALRVGGEPPAGGGGPGQSSRPAAVDRRSPRR